ncbi:MAG: sodium:calcium antiporter [Rhodobacteraceae bacterium]|nr:sodium:calcium antiporter [Paracoccaceae bacterium]
MLIERLLSETSASQNLAVFVAVATVVWLSGTRLAQLIDALADRLKLAKSLMGLLVLSLATSLPEVATTLSAALRQNQSLVLNNLFGGIALQTAILATADLWAPGAITNYPRKANHALEATLLMMLMAMMLIVIVLGEPVSFGPVGLGGIVIAIAYCGTIYLLRRYDDASDWVPVDLPDETPVPLQVLSISADTSTRMIIMQSVAACVAILVFGLALVASAEAVAETTGLGAGFIGVTLLAAATSMPELSTTIAAVRLGAYTMAISNIFGSNLIMLVLVLPADMLFTRGPILAGVGTTAMLSICFGMLVTAIFIMGMIWRRKPRMGRLGIDSGLVILAYLASLWIYYQIR